MNLIGCQVNHGNDCEEYLWLNEIPSDWKEEDGNTYDYYYGVIPEEYKEEVVNHVCWMMGLPEMFPECENEIGNIGMKWLLSIWN